MEDGWYFNKKVQKADTCPPKGQDIYIIMTMQILYFDVSIGKLDIF